MDSERLRRGQEIREKLFDPEVVKDGSPGARTLVPEIREISDVANWGTIWALEGLDLRTKSLCTITALLAAQRYDHARSHIEGAKRLGISAEEVAVAIAQLTFYVGLPVVHTGLNMTYEVFADLFADDTGAASG